MKAKKDNKLAVAPIVAKEFVGHKIEKKREKPDKKYRFACSSILEKSEGSKAIRWKADFDGSVEDFIYPSLHISVGDEVAESNRIPDYALDKDKDSPVHPNFNLRWKAEIQELDGTAIDPNTTFKKKIQKGERFLREGIIKKYHAKVIEDAREKTRLKEQIAHTRRANVLSTLAYMNNNSQSRPTTTGHDLYGSLVSNTRATMKRAVAKLTKMSFAERAYADLNGALASHMTDETRDLNQAVLFYQLRNEVKKKKVNDDLSRAAQLLMRNHSLGSQKRQSNAGQVKMNAARRTSFRMMRSTSPDIEPLKSARSQATDDSDTQSYTAMEYSAPTQLSRMTRAAKAQYAGFDYVDETPMQMNGTDEDSLDSSLSPMSLSDVSLAGRKRYAQDILLLKELGAGRLPEQLLKRIPGMGELDQGKLTPYDMLNISSLAGLDMLHTLGLRQNRLTTKSLDTILANLCLSQLVYVDLSQNDMRGNAVQALCALLNMSQCNIETLEIADTRISTRDVKNICASLKNHDLCNLTYLDVSGNSLDTAAAKYIASFIAYPGCALEHLDISWNSLDYNAGEVLAVALANNKSMTNLNLHGNSLRDEGGQHIAACLTSNKTMRKIDISVNNIGSKACFIFSKVLRGHPTMEKLVLNDNPLGEPGARALFRSILKGLKCFVAMQNCSFPPDDTSFNHSNPSLNSPYEIYLNKPYDTAIFFELVSMLSSSMNCSIDSLTYRPVDAKGASETTIIPVVKEHAPVTFKTSSGSAWQVPSTGLLRVHFSHKVSVPTTDMAITRTAFDTIIAVVVNARSDHDRKNWLMLMCVDAFFTTVQEMIDILEGERLIGAGGISKVDLFASIWSNLIDTVNVYDFMCANLDEDERLTLEHALTFEKFRFNWINPTGHWRLDLGSKIPRTVFMSLVACNSIESSFSETKSKRGDTSQKGNWCNFRNERLNGAEIAIDVDFTKRIPWTGVLEFDYVSTTRPSGTIETIEDTEFEKFLKKLGLSTRRRLPRSKGNTKLPELQIAVTKYYFSVADVLSILDCFSEDDATQSRVVICLFSRIDDLENFDVILRHLTNPCVQDVVEKLGALNALNPLKPSHTYHLRMKYIDNRRILHMLLELASQEPGDQLKENPRTQIPFITLYASLGRLIQDQVDAIVAFSYCELGERQCFPMWNLRKDLVKHFLLGTQPVNARIYGIVGMYKEIETAGMLSAGPVDLQYREYLRQKKTVKEKKLRGNDDRSYTQLPTLSSKESGGKSPVLSERREETSEDHMSSLLNDDYGRRRASVVN